MRYPLRLSAFPGGLDTQQFAEEIEAAAPGALVRFEQMGETLYVVMDGLSQAGIEALAAAHDGTRHRRQRFFQTSTTTDAAGRISWTAPPAIMVTGMVVGASGTWRVRRTGRTSADVLGPSGPAPAGLMVTISGQV